MSQNGAESKLLTVRSTRDDGTALIVLEGELDLSSVETAGPVLAELLDHDLEALGIDLRGLEFIDSSGLRFLLKGAAEAKQRGWQFFLVRGGEQVQRIIEVAGLESELTIYDSAEEAAAKAGG